MLGINLFQSFFPFRCFGACALASMEPTSSIGHSWLSTWLSSSLEISPEEQVAFLQKLLDNKLPVSPKSHEMTRAILFVENLPNGWKLYGKTGSGSLLNHDRSQKLDIQMGWFIGWIQNDRRAIAFAQYLEDEEKSDTYASLRAKTYAKQKLMHLIGAL